MTGVAAAIWLGAVLGVSFLATPVKFRAASLDRPTALDVGRVTFAAFSWAERLAWLAVATTLVFEGPSSVDVFLMLSLAGILLVQGAVLLPGLSKRAVASPPAEDPEASDLAESEAEARAKKPKDHLAYIGLEVLKSALLLALAILHAMEPVT